MNVYYLVLKQKIQKHWTRNNIYITFKPFVKLEEPISLKSMCTQFPNVESFFKLITTISMIYVTQCTCFILLRYYTAAVENTYSIESISEAVLYVVGSIGDHISEGETRVKDGYR